MHIVTVADEPNIIYGTSGNDSLTGGDWGNPAPRDDESRMVRFRADLFFMDRRISQGDVI
jgi:hypothetical protein